MVLLLASPGAAYVNGAHLHADGAMPCALQPMMRVDCPC
jgi:hypothetical protein